jgi:hypothetical protein
VPLPYDITVAAAPLAAVADTGAQATAYLGGMVRTKARVTVSIDRQSWTATTAATWLRLGQSTGNGDAAFDVAFDATGLAVGRHDTVVRIQAADGQRVDVPFALDVQPVQLVLTSGRPVFFKIAYHGPKAMEELVEYDPTLVVGILGGSSGTTRDTFELLSRAEAAGARIALFGRKIQRAESQLDLVALMRPVIRGDLTPADGVRAYHEALGAAGKTPKRSLTDDLQVTEPVLLAE